MSKISYYIKYGGDYRMPEPISALLWDLPLNQLTGRDVRVGEFLLLAVFEWQQNLMSSFG